MNTKLLLLLMLLASPVSAEIYKWVDEKGKVHYGDRVPEKYKDQAGDAGVEVRQPTEEEIAEAEARAREMKMSRMQMEASKKRAEREAARAARKAASNPYGNAPGGNMSDYDRQMAEYRKSQACYAACAQTGARAPITRRLPDGTSYQVPGGTYRDISACGHCRNVKKPSK